MCTQSHRARSSGVEIILNARKRLHLSEVGTEKDNGRLFERSFCGNKNVPAWGRARMLQAYPRRSHVHGSPCVFYSTHKRGLSPTICMSAIPATVVFIFVCVYCTHLRRASTLAEEAINIPKHFLSSKYTNFWVAEVYEPIIIKKSVPQTSYLILKESQLDSRLQDNQSYSKKIIGTAGLNRCDVMHESAWLRRMNVSSKYQRKGIGTALLSEAIDFCRKKGYESMELVTSECHDGARKLYLQKGFKLRQLYHKPILGTLVQVLMYQFTLAIPENDPDKKVIQY